MVIAIIAILAAILFPVFAQARDRARQASCQSNLKQFGIAFAMYASDYDGLYPNPGGRGVQGNTLNGAAWYSATRDATTNSINNNQPTDARQGNGLWPYIKQRGNGGANVWSCPNALPGGDSGNSFQFDVGQNYVMNDYARQATCGQAATAVGNCPPAYFPAMYTGLDPDRVGAGSANPRKAAGPAQFILLFEVVQNVNGGNNRNGSIYFSTSNATFGRSRYGNTGGTNQGLPMGAPEEYHAGGANFLFADSHVKWMKPTQTWTSDTQAQVNQFNAPYATANGGRVGAGTVDLWDPNAGDGQMVYP